MFDATFGVQQIARRGVRTPIDARKLEETAKLFLLLRSHKIRPLTPDQVADLRARFKL